MLQTIHEALHIALLLDITFFVLDPGSSFQMPVEHFYMHVLLSAETFISYLELLLISPPLFSAGDLPLSQSLRDTSTRHHSLFPLHSLSHLISHGVLFFGMSLSSSSHGYSPPLTHCCYRHVTLS